MIATGEAHSVRECCEVAFDEAGLGDFEQYVDDRPGVRAPGRGRPPDRRPRARPSATSAGSRETSFEELIRLMTRADLELLAAALSAMAVPLFDTAAPLAPLRDELRAAIDARARLRALHPRPRGRGVRAGVRRVLRRARTPSASPTAPTRSRSRCARWASVRATRSSCRRSRSTPPPRRSRRPAPRRSSATSTRTTYCVTAETVRAALTPRTKAVIAVHLFGNVAPVAEIEALGVPVLEDAAQAAGSTSTARARPGALGTVATFSFFPSKNLGCFGDGGAITTDDAAIAERARDAALPRLARQGHLRAGRLQLAPGRAAGGDPARAAAAPRRLGRRPPRRPARHYEEAGLGELVDAAARRAPAPRPAWHLYVVATSAGRARSKRALARGGHRPQALLPHAGAPPAGDARAGATGVELPAHRARPPRTHLAIPMSPVLTRAQADEVVAAAPPSARARA